MSDWAFSEADINASGGLDASTLGLGQPVDWSQYNPAFVAQNNQAQAVSSGKILGATIGTVVGGPAGATVGADLGGGAVSAAQGGSGSTTGTAGPATGTSNFSWLDPSTWGNLAMRGLLIVLGIGFIWIGLSMFRPREILERMR